MSGLPTDLLEQALHLARKEPKRPKQASLRRAVSAAYYALFHDLIDRSSRFLLPGERRRELRMRVMRCFEHRKMKETALELVASRSRPGPISGEHPQLVKVAETFVILQRERHEADYDLTRRFTRGDVLAHISRTEAAVRAWERLEGSPEAEAFMVALLVPFRRR